MKTEEIDNEMRHVRTSELKALKAALEMAQFYASEYKARDEEDEAKHHNEEVEIASAIDLIRAMIHR